MNNINKVLLILLIALYSSFLRASDPFNAPSQLDSSQPISSILLHLYYASAEDIGKSLMTKSAGLLSASGSIVVDQRTNTIWVQDNEVHLAAIKKFISKIDVPVKQIQIEARIVNIDENSTRELGTEFGTVKSGGDSTNNVKMDFPSSAMQPGRFNFTIATLSDDTLLDMELSALESEGHAKIESRPKLDTIDRKPAYINSGEDIPYQGRTAEGNTDVTFKQAVLGLKVTPEIITKDKILLHITVAQDKVSALLVQGVPAISTREINTQVVVKNKQTVVLGGIYEQAKTNKVVRIPGLGSIPYLGALFRYTESSIERKELLIFITPEILNGI
jgi:type IV pilus assembly protein PilQ